MSALSATTGPLAADPANGPLAGAAGGLLHRPEAEAAVYPGLPQDLSPASRHGRTLRPESAAGELLDSSAVARPPARPSTIWASSRSGIPRSLRPEPAAAEGSPGSSSTGPSGGARGRKTLKNRPCTTAARRRRTATRTWSSSTLDEQAHRLLEPDLRRQDARQEDRRSGRDRLSAGGDLVQGYRIPRVRAGGEGDLPGEKKSRPRGELTAAEKRTNRKLARIRVRVEHALAGVKRCRIVKDVLRNTKEGVSDAAMEAACGLHNLRVREPQEASKERSSLFLIKSIAGSDNKNPHYSTSLEGNQKG